jgi:hypothetical protein
LNLLNKQYGNNSIIVYKKKASDIQLSNFSKTKLSSNKQFNKLNAENSKFALIHNSGSDGKDRIDYSKINPELKIIKVSPEHTDNIFSYLGLVYRAEEIHCVESCFNVLVDSLDVYTKLFYHKNHNRRSIEKNQHKLKKQWIIV